jgi:hypothetical protein
MRRLATIKFSVALACVLALACWFRVSSLGTMPGPDGDESWYPIQAYHLLKGKPFQAITPNGNPINPFFTGLHVPFLLTSDPSVWRLKVPGAACGLLAVVLAYILFRKGLDRPTALMASVGLAVAPVAIIYSRISFDACQTPMMSILALYCALRGHRIGLVASLVAAYLVHPTNIFLLPAVLPVFLTQELRRYPGDRVRQSRVVLATLSAAGVATLVVGLLMFRQRYTQSMYRPTAGPQMGYRDWALYLTNCRRLLLGITGDTPPGLTRRYDLLFWGPCAVVVALGLARLVRARQWERVAVIGGTLASVVGFYVVCGAKAFPTRQVYDLRYGLFMLVPVVLTLACAGRALLIEPTTPAREFGRWAQQAVLLGLAVALLVGAKVNWFDICAGRERESIWTFGADDTHHFELAATLFRQVSERESDPARHRVLVTESYWERNPLQYLTLKQKHVRVVARRDWEERGAEGVEHALAGHMDGGGYAVVFIGDALATTLSSLYPKDRILRWTPPNLPGRGVRLMRLRALSPDPGAPLSAEIAVRPGAALRR